MEEEKILTGQESLEVINRMIKSAQHDIEDSSFYYLFWGWLVFAAAISQFLLMQSGNEYSYLPWAILMPLGGIITMIYSRKIEKKQKVKTYIDDVMKYVMIAFIVSLFIVLFFMSKFGLATYPMVMMIYGIWLFISGGAIKFQPIVIGGILNWGLAIVALFFEFEIQLLLLAAAVLVGYIIPGHLLKAKFKNHATISEAV